MSILQRRVSFVCEFFFYGLDENLIKIAFRTCQKRLNGFKKLDIYRKTNVTTGKTTNDCNYCPAV